MEIRKISRRRSRSVDDAEFGHIHVVVLQSSAKKCTKIYNARAQLLFYSLNLLFSDVLAAVVVVVCLSFLVLKLTEPSWISLVSRVFFFFLAFTSDIYYRKFLAE